MQLFETAAIGNVTLPNRIIRSATFEGRADDQGVPLAGYRHWYEELAKNGVGAIITGFVYIAQTGKAMQPRQAGMDHADKISAFLPVTQAVHRYPSRIFLQLAHTGRQTRRQETGFPVYGVSKKPSPYFGGQPDELSTEQVFAVIARFIQAAVNARQAGFDGVQLHAAHGYLIHQFLNPAINRRRDLFQERTRFLGLIIDGIKSACGKDFPILVKVSGGGNPADFVELIKFLDGQKVAAIEVSYGTMDAALNIIRGDIPYDLILRHNPIYKARGPLDRAVKRLLMFPVLKASLKPFTPVYNLAYARIAKQHTSLPVICLGGIRQAREMRQLVESEGMDFVSLCRPFICEPDLVEKIRQDENYASQCVNCNYCTVLCDANQPTRCHRKEIVHESGR